MVSPRTVGHGWRALSLCARAARAAVCLKTMKARLQATPTPKQHICQ